MKDRPYRSIFPNNNVPSLKVDVKAPKLQERLSDSVKSLINYVNFSRIQTKLKEIEFKEKVQHDPSNALLEQLKEIENNNKQN